MALVRGAEPVVKSIIDLHKTGIDGKLTEVEAFYTATDPIVLPRPTDKAYHYARLRVLDSFPTVIVLVPRVGYGLRVGKSVMATKDRGGGLNINLYWVHRHDDPDKLARIMMRYARASFQLLTENWSLANTVMELSVTAEEFSVPLLGANDVFFQVSRSTLLVQKEEGF